MRALRQLLDRVGKPFHKGGKYERFFPLYEAADTFFYSPADVTKTGAHVRDAMDLKRMMILVVIAVLPCVFMAFYNTGLQANLAIDPAKAGALEGWRHAVIRLLGVGSVSYTHLDVYKRQVTMCSFSIAANRPNSSRSTGSADSFDARA